MEIDAEGTYYMDEDPMVLMLREEGNHREPPAIVEATTELKNWTQEGLAHPKEDFVEKIKNVEPITLAKNIVFIPIESISASIIIPVKSVCDHIPIESVSIESVQFVDTQLVLNHVVYLNYRNEHI